jgi:hypothetical protein
MDIELFFGFEARFVLARVNTIHRANVHAGSVFCTDTGLRDYIRHLNVSSVEGYQKWFEPSAGNPDARFLNNFYIIIGKRAQAGRV